MNTDSLSPRRIASALGLLALVLAVATMGLVAVPQVIGAEHSYTVLSSSMSPTIHAGDVIVVNDVPASQIEKGDIITFVPPGGAEGSGANRITHRVHEVVIQNGEQHYRTKGDALESPDSWLVSPENVVGVVWFSIPFLGHFVELVNTQMGLVVFVVAAVLLGVNELVSLYREATNDDTNHGN